MFNILAKASTIFLCLTLLACNADKKVDKPTENPQERDLATEQMKAELKSLATDKSNINVWHLNKLRAQAIDQRVQSINDPAQRISMIFKSGIEWLNAGEYELAISRLQQILDFVAANKLPTEAKYGIKEVLGMAYLRKAEIENCIQNHNEYSCLLPIEKQGQHTQKEGSEKALSIFKELIEGENPKLRTQWLYNIAHMTLGSYPEGIEPQYLIKESLFDSDIAFPRFKEIGSSLGVGVNDISGGVIMDDFNADGYLDLMVSSYGLDDQLRYFQNNGSNGFEDLTEQSGLLGMLSGLNMIQADYNNDGLLDFLVLRGAWLGKDGTHPNSLLQNNGDGTFSDVTRKSGLYCKYPTQTASWFDYNNDGWIDLFIGNESSNNLKAAPQLYENNGDGTFKEVGQSKGLPKDKFIKGCIAGDYNNDGYQDLYISVINNTNMLMMNQGPEKQYAFVNQAKQANTEGPLRSFPCWFFDYNQDGWEDLFVSGFDFRQFDSAAGQVAKGLMGLPTQAELPKLYKNNQDGTFSDVTKEAKMDKVLYTMGSNFGDLNNDGYPDVYAGTGTPDFRALIPNKMFLNAQGSKFYDITTAGGFGHLQKGHGVAFGDLDNDGDQDIYTVLGGSYDGDNFMNALFLNPGFNKNWIKLKLEGTTSNRSAIGARVEIVAMKPSGETRSFYQRVNSGASFGANPLRIEQGLGDFSEVKSVKITWPGEATAQILEGFSANAFYIIKQGSKELEKQSNTAFDFELEHEHMHHH